MRLYKAELFKLLSRKVFIIGFFSVLCFIMLFFAMNVSEERTTIDGKLYTGYEAIQMNRKITAELGGLLTDEKAKQIIDTYGFPQKVEEGYGGFRDENYLNGFVTTHLGNGYLYDWDDYVISTELIPISQTELGEIQKINGDGILLEYTTGWTVFFDIIQIGMVLGSILILFTISVVFAEEKQCNMFPLLFTCEDGKEKDTAVKICASFTIATVIYAVITLFMLILCGLVYGFDGLHSIIGLVFTETPNTLLKISMTSVAYYIIIKMIINYLALNCVCAIVLFVSAHYQSSFHAVIVSSIIWGVPILIIMLLDGIGSLLMCGTPLFLVMSESLMDIYGVIHYPITVAMLILVCCTVSGYRKYTRLQVEA